MDISAYIVGIIPPDEKFKKMLAVYDACTKANVEVPEDVDDFFNNAPPNDLGVEIDLENDKSVEKINGQGSQGFTIDISKIPENIKYISFYYSY